MKIWIENPFDNLPIEGFRAQRYWLMAEAFRNAGHEVTLWTSDFNHTTKRKRVVLSQLTSSNAESCKDLLAFDPRNTEDGKIGSLPKLRFIPTLPYYKNVSIRRMVSHIAYAIKWWRDGNKLLKPLERLEPLKPDLIILSTPPICTGLVALYFKKRYGTKVVLDIMDLWPETFERVAPKWALWPMKKLSGFIRNHADLVTSVADAYPGKTFYHGIELGVGVGVGVGAGLRIVYIGNLGVTYDLKTVIEAVKKIEGATLKIAGEGAQADMVKAAAAESNGKIEYLGYLGKSELDELLLSSDIGIVPMSPESCVGVPYKFADYAKAGLAIVSSLGGESLALLKEYGAGAEYSPHEVESLKAAIEALRVDLSEAKEAARKLAEEKLDSKKIYKSYVDYVTN